MMTPFCLNIRVDCFVGQYMLELLLCVLIKNIASSNTLKYEIVLMLMYQLKAMDSDIRKIRN